MSKASREWKAWCLNTNVENLYGGFYFLRKNYSKKAYMKAQRFINQEKKKTQKRNADFESIVD